LSSNWLESSDGKPVFVVSEPSFLGKGDCEGRKWALHLMNTIILEFLKIITRISAPFFESIPAILLYRCEDSIYDLSQC
jgi:hypothetical protein